MVENRRGRIKIEEEEEEEEGRHTNSCYILIGQNAEYHGIVSAAGTRNKRANGWR